MGSLAPIFRLLGERDSHYHWAVPPSRNSLQQPGFSARPNTSALSSSAFPVFPSMPSPWRILFIPHISLLFPLICTSPSLDLSSRIYPPSSRLSWRQARRPTCSMSFLTLGTSAKNCSANIAPTTPKLPSVMPLLVFVSRDVPGHLMAEARRRAMRWDDWHAGCLRTILTLARARCPGCWAGFCSCVAMSSASRFQSSSSAVEWICRQWCGKGVGVEAGRTLGRKAICRCRRRASRLRTGCRGGLGPGAEGQRLGAGRNGGRGGTMIMALVVKG